MWDMSGPWWEYVARGSIIYAVLFIVMRTTNKKEIGQLTPFDFVLLMLLSNAAQNSMNGGDNSVHTGIILIATLLIFNYLVSNLAKNNKSLEKIFEGRPQVIIHNGKINEDILKKSCLTHHQLNEALRLRGIATLSDIHYAIIETNGEISATTRVQQGKD